eukprot:2714042-Pyramimonas_sp.AAC.1
MARELGSGNAAMRAMVTFIGGLPAGQLAVVFWRPLRLARQLANGPDGAWMQNASAYSPCTAAPNPRMFQD